MTGLDDEKETPAAQWRDSRVRGAIPRGISEVSKNQRISVFTVGGRLLDDFLLALGQGENQRIPGDGVPNDPVG